jgi:RHS repeat-associated protein
MKTLRYFYHPDHLGSSSWITDGSGNAIQHLHYLPFGEDWVDQRNASWSAPYTFSGKEKDVETGYGYFGARYYDSGLSIWLSVDPMSDKYPSMSPYNYCEYNPVIYIDPNGKEKINALDPSTNAHAYKGIRHYTRNIGVVHLWAHGNENAMLFYNKSHKSNHMITTSNQVHNYLLENSVIYRNNNKEGEESKTTLLVLHSCKTGVQDGIAQKVSNELNVLVIAPTDILSQRSKADGSSVSESVDNNGEWSIYYKGQLMETFNGDTKPLFDNSQKTIEKYEKMYQEKYGNENNSK